MCSTSQGTTLGHLKRTCLSIATAEQAFHGITEQHSTQKYCASVCRGLAQACFFEASSQVWCAWLHNMVLVWVLGACGHKTRIFIYTCASCVLHTTGCCSSWPCSGTLLLLVLLFSTSLGVKHMRMLLWSLASTPQAAAAPATPACCYQHGQTLWTGVCNTRCGRQMPSTPFTLYMRCIVDLQDGHIHVFNVAATCTYA